MDEKHIKRAVAIWLAFPPAETGALSGVVSFSAQTEGVRFHSYRELMALLRRLAAVTPPAEHPTLASMLKLAS